jgi:single-strand DNA-binding protein
MERYSTEIQCTDFTFLTNKNEQQQPQQSNAPSASTQPQQPAQKGVAPDGNDDLPF